MAKKAAADQEQKYRSTHRLTYLNVTYPEGAIVTAAETGWDDADIENLVKGGDMVPLSDADADAHEETKRLRAQQTTQAPLDVVDKVIATVRGEDVAFIDHRVKGPNEPPMGEREPHVTRLPPGDIPSDAPLPIHEQALAGSRKMKVEKPQELPPRNADEGATSRPLTAEEQEAADKAAKKSKK